jgi:hypothetical protein
MGYLIRLDSLPSFLRSDVDWGRDYFTSNFPSVMGRPEHAFPHLCFVFGPTSLTHVGVVLRKGDSNSTFTYKLNVVHTTSVGDPLPLAELSATLHGAHRKSIDKALSAGNGTLTEAADANIVQVLKALRPKFADRLDWLMDVRVHHVESPAADRLVLGKDALRGGFRMGGFSTDRLDNWVLPADAEAPVLAGIKREDYEVDLIVPRLDPGTLTAGRGSDLLRRPTSDGGLQHQCEPSRGQDRRGPPLLPPHHAKHDPRAVQATRRQQEGPRQRPVA